MRVLEIEEIDCVAGGLLRQVAIGLLTNAIYDAGKAIANSARGDSEGDSGINDIANSGMSA
jgi:hypothetical protein